jgi:copper(I)-binding protein
MKRPTRLVRATFTALLAFTAAAGAHEYYTASFIIVHPWSMPTPTGATTAPVYLKFDQITAGDRLIGARSDFADKVELRSKVPVGSMNENSPLEASVALDAGSTADLAPGSTHLLMLGLKAPLQWGRSYPLTLVSEKSGEVQTMLSVGSH